MNNKAVVGHRLKQARQAMGLTQAEVAAILAVARTTIVAIEQGKRRVSETELAAFGQMYGQPPEFFERNTLPDVGDDVISDIKLMIKIMKRALKRIEKGRENGDYQQHH